jgi:hypothetical protein
MNEPSNEQPERPSAPPPAASSQIDYAAWALIGGGFLVFIGVYLKWFDFSASVGGFSTSASSNGTSDWTGVVAVIAGLVAIGAGGAALLLSDDIKRTARLIGATAGVVALIVTVIAFFRVSSVGVDLPTTGGAAASIDAKAAVGLYVSFLGAVIATVGGAMAMRRAAADL